MTKLHHARVTARANLIIGAIKNATADSGDAIYSQCWSTTTDGYD